MFTNIANNMMMIGITAEHLHDLLLGHDFSDNHRSLLMTNVNECEDNQDIDTYRIDHFYMNENLNHQSIHHTKTSTTRILLIDCRSFFAHNESHIIDSINVFCPPFLRRRNGTKPLLKTLFPDDLIQHRLTDDYYFHIILYDDTDQLSTINEANDHDNMTITNYVAKCLQEEAGIKYLSYLEGGFSHFRSLYPSLCTNTSKQSSLLLSSSSSISLLNSTTNDSTLNNLYMNNNSKQSNSTKSPTNGTNHNDNSLGIKNSNNHSTTKTNRTRTNYHHQYMHYTWPFRTKTATAATNKRQSHLKHVPLTLKYLNDDDFQRLIIDQNDDNDSNGDKQNHNEPAELLPYLYLGNECHASSKNLLLNLGITAVLNVSKSCPNHFENEFNYKRIPISDSKCDDITIRINEALNFIDKIKEDHNGKILVHCQAGISRSATICIAYLIKKKRIRMEEAYEFVRSRRQLISPNFNFMTQLMEFEDQIFSDHKQI